MLDHSAADADARDGIALKRACFILAAVCLALIPSHATADGGAVVDRGRYGAFDVTVFLSPISPMTGPVDLSMLVARSGDPQLDVSVRVRMIGPSGVVEEFALERADSGNRLLWSGSCDLAHAGIWQCVIRIGSDARDQGAFALTIAPAPAHWVTLLPWMLIWIPIALLLVARERLVARQRTSRHAWIE